MGKWGTARKFTPAEAAEAVRLYSERRLSLGEVGRLLNRDPSSIRAMFKRHGIKIRDAKTGYREYVARKQEAEAAEIAKVVG